MILHSGRDTPVPHEGVVGASADIHDAQDSFHGNGRGGEDDPAALRLTHEHYFIRQHKILRSPVFHRGLVVFRSFQTAQHCGIFQFGIRSVRLAIATAYDVGHDISFGRERQTQPRVVVDHVRITRGEFPTAAMTEDHQRVALGIIGPVKLGLQIVVTSIDACGEIRHFLRDGGLGPRTHK